MAKHELYCSHQRPPVWDTLKGAGLMVKSFGNKLYVLAQTLDGLKPHHDLPKSGVFSFYLQPADADFYQYSNLPLKGGSTNRYYFSNREDAMIEGKNYLHARHPVFDTNKTHTVGSLCRAGRAIVTSVW